MKYKNIAISGDIGTGKSTLADNLARTLNWKVMHAGEFFRKWHEDNNIPVVDSYKIPEELDRKIDLGYQKMMISGSEKIFESHLAGWLAKDLPEVLNVLCVSTPEVKMRRAASRDHLKLSEEKEIAKKRAQGYSDKFKKLYGVENHLDESYFDLIVDTTTKTKEEVLQTVLEKMEES